jgi:hypothetical protein
VQSYEAWIESKAGACPPPGAEAPNPDDWPQPKPPPYPADDEGDARPERAGDHLDGT